jgi:outer membrane lipoprotein carrier protein
MNALRKGFGVAAGNALAWVICATSLVAIQTPGPPPGAPPADELARRLQARYAGIRDFSADFTQTYRGGVLRKTTTERGSVSVKKPGRMRWTYTAPEEKLFVADGVRMYIYVPADKQVMVRKMPAVDTATSPILFLAGRGDVGRDFQAAYATLPSAPSGSWVLKLTPRESQPDYEWLTVALDPRTLAIRMLSARDAQGGESTFTFTNLKENVGISDNTFTFRIPRGVDVITEG